MDGEWQERGISREKKFLADFMDNGKDAERTLAR